MTAPERGAGDGVGTDLAVLVRKPDAEAAIDSLQTEGVYDSTRSVDTYDEDRIAIPVVEEPVETPVQAIQTIELPLRKRGLEDVLAERGFSAAEIDAAPSSWAVVGSVILADFGDVSAEGEEVLDAGGRRAVGEALLELHANADTVLARGGIDGTCREPATTAVAGAGETETVHVEHGTKYALDLSKVMFSPGNEAERVRMGEVVDADERVFDMFAGVGYFTLPMARGGAVVTATEINPDAYRLLVENAALNDVTERVRPIFGDCREVETTADRVVMGHYEASRRDLGDRRDGSDVSAAYLDAALEALVPGGVLHLHEATPESRFPARPIERLEAAADEADRAVAVIDSRVVKSYSPGVVHGVIDAHL